MWVTGGILQVECGSSVGDGAISLCLWWTVVVEVTVTVGGRWVVVSIMSMLCVVVIIVLFFFGVDVPLGVIGGFVIIAVIPVVLLCLYLFLLWSVAVVG